MSRNPEIEKILSAWWILDHCAPPQRAKALGELNQLLDLAVAKSNGLYTRHQIKEALWNHYKSFRAAEYRDEAVRVAQTAMKTP